MMKTLGAAAAVWAVCAGGRRALEGRQSRDLGAVRFKPLWNRGAAFGLPVSRNVVAALSLLSLSLVWLGRRRSPLGAGLLLGGGFSNLWERLRYGEVFDCIQFPRAPGRLKRYVLNPADFAVFAGVLAMLRGRRSP